MASVAVVVPLHTRAYLTPDEEISVRHLLHHLGRYDRYLISPASLDFRLPGFEVKRFHDRYFGSAEAHTRLLLSPHFYETFGDYDYILMYHLDALVFSDQLETWCEKGFDYIGAPWPLSREEPEQGLSRVGNGGFSLRRVSSFLRVMASKRLWRDPEARWQRIHGSKPWPLRLLHLPKRYLLRWPALNGVRTEMNRFPRNEDFFWSDQATHYDPDFRIAPVEEGLRFSFEIGPRYCFELSGGRLPFGCHAWPSYDREFWEPYLLDADDIEPAVGGVSR